MDVRSILNKINGYQILYVLWLLFLMNVFTFKQLTVSEISDDKRRVTDVKIVRKQPSSSGEIKKILLWNAWYGDFGFKLDDELAFQRQNCKVTNCVVSKDKNMLRPETADAIIFLYTNLCELPKIYSRKDYQRYVLLTDDPPICYSRNYYNREPYFGSFFNWTMSYRRNADIIWKRGWIKKVDKAPQQTAMARYHDNQLIFLSHSIEY